MIEAIYNDIFHIGPTSTRFLLPPAVQCVAIAKRCKQLVISDRHDAVPEAVYAVVIIEAVGLLVFHARAYVIQPRSEITETDLSDETFEDAVIITGPAESVAICIRIPHILETVGSHPPDHMGERMALGPHICIRLITGLEVDECCSDPVCFYKSRVMVFVAIEVGRFVPSTYRIG